MDKPISRSSIRPLELIDTTAPAWKVVESWAKSKAARLRLLREDPGADIRKLDQTLGGITILKELLDLPAEIRKERSRDPIRGDSFDIPSL